MKKIILSLLLMVLISIPITGCGSGSDSDRQQESVSAEEEAERSQVIRDAYVKEEIALPQQSIFYETVYGDVLYYLNYIPGGEGGVPERESAVCTADLSQGKTQPELSEFSYAPEAGWNVGKIAAGPGGSVYVITSLYHETSGGVEDICLTKLDADGAVQWSESVYELFDGQNAPYVSALETDAAGNACIVVNHTIYIVDQSGSPAGSIACGDAIFRLFGDGTGKLYVIWLQGEVTMIAQVDSTGQTVTGGKELSTLRGLIGAGGGPEGMLVLATDSSVYEYDPDEKTLTELYQWFALDLAVDSYDQVFPLTDGRILLVDRRGDQWGSGSTALTVIRERREGETAAEQPPAEAASGVQEPIQGETGDVVLGTAGRLDPAFEEAIIAFNQSHPEGRIEVRDYGTEDQEAGIDQLSADIVSGNCPDILLVSPQQISLELYAAMGVLEDLNPYIDSDDVLQRTDLQENILQAYETDGKLTCIPISFHLDTIMGKTAALGDRTEWNLDGLIAFADEVDQDRTLFMDASRSAVMELCMKANGDYIVDWSAGDGNGFRRDFFIRMLEFSNRFIPDEQFTEDMWTQSLMDKQMQLMSGGLSPISFQHSPLGESFTCIGYPSESGSGTLTTSYAAAAVSSTCAAKGTAWQFISSLLSEEVQSHPGLESGYPIRRSSLKTSIERSKEASGTVMSGDQSGNIIDQYELRGATEEEIQLFQDLIDSVEKAVKWDGQIQEIMLEESGAYFNGSKTAEEVADIVENRIGLYVSEAK